MIRHNRIYPVEEVQERERAQQISVLEKNLIVRGLELIHEALLNGDHSVTQLQWLQQGRSFPLIIQQKGDLILPQTDTFYHLLET